MRWRPFGRIDVLRPPPPRPVTASRFIDHWALPQQDLGAIAMTAAFSWPALNNATAHARNGGLQPSNWETRRIEEGRCYLEPARRLDRNPATFCHLTSASGVIRK